MKHPPTPTRRPATPMKRPAIATKASNATKASKARKLPLVRSQRLHQRPSKDSCDLSSFDSCDLSCLQGRKMKKIVDDLAAMPKQWLQRPFDRNRLNDAHFQENRIDDEVHHGWAACLAELATGFAASGSANIVLNVWSDCAGMSSETFALKLLAQEVAAQYPGITLTVNLVGCCEKKVDCQHFLETNFQPRIICQDMHDRRLEDGRVWVLNKKTGNYEEIPHGLSLYVLGFPCTPWSKRGRGLGFGDSNSEPVTIGLRTIKTVEPLTFCLECAEV